MTLSPSRIDKKWSPTAKALIAAIGVALIMQIFMVFRFEVNQDEFYSLNIAYEAIRGQFTNPFQTFFFRITRLLQYVPGNEVDQIVVGRMAIYVCAAITCLMIYKTSRRYFSVEASLFALLAFFSFSFVFRHMTAFRYDMVVTMLLMTTLWVVSDPEQNWKKVIASGLLIGLSFTFALKSIFYMPIVAVFLLGRWITSDWSKHAFFQGLVMFVLAVSTYALLYVLHDTAAYAPDSGAEYLKRISGNSFFTGFFRKGGIFLYSFMSNIFAWGLIGIGIFAVVLGLIRDKKRTKLESCGILSLAFSLLPIVVFFHANPYFYPFMLAPAVIFIAAAADKFLIDKFRLIFPAFMVIFCLLITNIFIKSMTQDQSEQRATLNAIHEMFPEPVPFIDYCGMISSFDRVNESGLFINPYIFAMAEYREAQQPIMTDLIPKYKPEIMLTNTIRYFEGQEISGLFDNELVDEDTALIENNYIQFWGPVYIPGKYLKNNRSFEILMDGLYTYYGPAGVQIDGVVLKNGETLNLEPGAHSVQGLLSGEAKIVWGDNLKKPDIPEPTRELFNGF